ncbi:type II toxin-antitoxin system HicB family antitoxin [Arsenicicoccus dermatophilus]|uniref:type II toxin-antitoxin system HicB family antitoxin n=1 Tax=Arsenicicoccus dermatophilus TaxID=1076331 RepID=UPI003917546E
MTDQIHIPDVARYSYRVTFSPEDDEFVATCLELPSLSWLANSPEQALRGLRDLATEIVEDMARGGESVPEPFATRSYSGKFNVRIGEELHRRLAMEAADSHVSLNQHILTKLSAAS